MSVRELVENSFPYDEPVMVRDNGRIRITPIGELVERRLAEGSSLHFNGRSYRHLSELLEVLTLDENLKLAFKRLTAVFKHPAPRKLWSITLQAGRVVRTTSVHNVFVADDESQILGKETRLLKQGDRVVVPAGELMAGTMDEIDLLEELSLLDSEIFDKIVTRGAASLYPVNLPKTELLLMSMGGRTATRSELHTVAGGMGFENPDNLIHTLRKKGALVNEGRGEYRPEGLKQFKHTYNIPKDWVHCDAVPLSYLIANPPPMLNTANLQFSVKQGRGVLPRIIKVTAELMRILGYYTSEGSVHAGYKVSFSFGSHEMDTHVKDLIECLGKVFGIKPMVTIEHGTAVNVVINDTILAIFLQSVLRAGSGSSDKRVPWLVLNVKKELAEEYLKAYVHGDGHVQTAKSNRKITMATSSDALFTDLKFLLTLLGRYYTTSYKGPMDRTINGVTGHFEGSHYIYVRQGMGPEACSIPIMQFRDMLRPWSRGKSNIYNKTVQKKWLKENFAPEQLPPSLRAYTYSDAGALAIRKVEEYDSSDEWVYDIAVEGVERFIGGGAVALLHNSLDAAEMAGTLPDVYVRIIPEGPDSQLSDPKPYRLSVIDNGPGVSPQHVPSAFGKVFYGSKYVLRQSRGMFGLGGTMAILYGQITTNKPVNVTTSADGKWKHAFQMIIDIGENRPTVLKLSLIHI